MALQLIDGGKDALENEFQMFVAAPESFDEETFQKLATKYRERLGIDAILAMYDKRLRIDCNTIEKKALLAALTGDDEEAKRLGLILERRNQLGFELLEGSR